MEILAPCGSMESFKAAANSGADAVYLGLKKFSARGNAANFDFDELEQVVNKSRLYGMKVYLTVNTLVFDNEFAELREYISKAAECGINAVIVQDFGVVSLVKEIAPKLPLHASTQMTVTSVSGVKMLKKAGFSRVVLARELSREEIRKIACECLQLGIGCEVFVHGAHCVSVSGQCYMSSLLGGNIARSGNRGMCAQPCRLDFRCDGNTSGEQYALSLKDLSLIEHIKELGEIGVTSLKIEGRMKRPEYVFATVEACRNALNGIPPNMELLGGVFSRSGFTDGYFIGDYTDMQGFRTKQDVMATAKALEQIKTDFNNKSKNPYKRYTVDFHIEITADKPALCIATVGNTTVSVGGEIPEAAVNRCITADSVKTQLSKLGGTVFEVGKTECRIDNRLMLRTSAVNQLRRRVIEELSERITRTVRKSND